MWWSTSSVSVIGVRPQYSVGFLSWKLTVFRLLKKLHMPNIHNQMYKFCVCVPSNGMLFMWGCQRWQMEMKMSWKRALWIKQLSCNLFFGWEDITYPPVGRLLVCYCCYYGLRFVLGMLLWSLKQLLFYIERQFDIIYKFLSSEPVVTP